MTRFNLATIFDGILSFLCSLILSLGILRIINTPYPLALSFSIVLALAFSFFIVLRKRKAYKNKLLQGIVSREKMQLMNKLALLKNSEIIDLFKDLLKDKCEEICCCENSVRFKNHSLVPMFYIEPITANQIIDKLKMINLDKTAVIIGAGFSQQAINFANANKIKLIAIDRVYDFIKASAPQLLNPEVGKTRFSFPLQNLFQRKNGLKFIFYGITLEFFSLLTFFPVYYVTFGTIFIVFGIIISFFGKSTEKSNFSFEELN